MTDTVMASRVPEVLTDDPAPLTVQYGSTEPVLLELPGAIQFDQFDPYATASTLEATLYSMEHPPVPQELDELNSICTNDRLL